MIKKVLLSSAFALIFSPLAHATTITEVFTLNQSSALTGTAGTVTLTQLVGSDTVHIDVELNPNYSFRSNTDPQHTGFVFDSSVALTVASFSNLTTGWAADSPAPGSYNDTPFGTFSYGLDCSSPTCVNGPTKNSAQDQVSLQFDVTASGLTISSFVSNGSAIFVADLLQYQAGGGTQTGAIAATSGGGITRENDPPSVPEPSSLALLGTGLAGMAEMIRRRMR